MSAPPTLLAALLSILLAAPAEASPPPDPPPPPEMIESLLPFGAQREALTEAYRVAHQGVEGAGSQIVPRLIVLHHTAGPTAASAIQTFSPETLPGSRPELQGAGALNVSAHFLVDRDGTIYRLLPDDVMARHCIGLNHVSVGIENVGGLPDAPLTEAQVQANAALVRYLAAAWPITHLIGHLEYQEMEGHPYFVELDDGYRTQKVDPAGDFLDRVRAEIAELGLEGPP